MAKTPRPPVWKEPPPEGISVYRFVEVEDRNPDRLVAHFKSDAEEEKEPFDPREKAYPELLDGMSTFKTLEHARREFERIHRNYGEETTMPRYVAEVRITPGKGFMYEDLGSRARPKGHQTLKGSPRRLAEAVVKVYPVQRNADQNMES